MRKRDSESIFPVLIAILILGLAMVWSKHVEFMEKCEKQGKTHDQCWDESH